MNLKEIEKQMGMMMGGTNGGVPHFTSPSTMISNIKNKFKKWLKKNTKKIIIYSLIILTVIFGFKIMLSEKKGVYLVTDSLGIEYNTNQYIINGQCVEFNRNKKNRLITICGDFKIVKQQKK